MRNAGSKLVQLRVARLEYAHWARAAAHTGMRVSELIRTATRQQVLELERLRLLERRDEARTRGSAFVAREPEPAEHAAVRERGM